MLAGKTIAVVIKAYNEEKQIRMVIESLPGFVDRIVVVNDGSKDDTAEIVKDCISKHKGSKIIKKIEIEIEDSIWNKADLVWQEIIKRSESKFPKHTVFNDNDTDTIVLINEENSGAGAAVATGYKWCRDHGIDCTAVIDGDGQMNPYELENIVSPVINEGIDYVKGNRLSHPASKAVVPQIRYFGNNILTLMTKIASGYWSVSDAQTGYTAISLNALNRLPLHLIYRQYGYPNDILNKLNIAKCTMREVQIKPVYSVGEQSKMRIMKVIPRMTLLLTKCFFRRLWQKYFVDSFHPIFLMYFAGLIMGIVNIPILIKIIIDVFVRNGSVTMGWYITFLLLSLFSFQSISFGMWMDVQDNEKLISEK